MKILTIEEVSKLHRDYEAALAKNDQVAMRQAEDDYIKSFAIFPGNLSDLIRDTNQVFRGWTPNSSDGRVYRPSSGIITFRTFDQDDPSPTRDSQLKLLTLMKDKVVGMTNPQEALESILTNFTNGISRDARFVTKGYAFRHITNADMPYDSSG